MKDLEFFNSFVFRETNLCNTNHRDNSSGVPLHYIGYMKKGRGLLVLEKGKVELNAGDMFYIPKGCRYHSYWIGDPEVSLDSLGFACLPDATGEGYRPQKLTMTPQVWKAYAPLSWNKTIDAGSIGRLYTVLGMLLPQMQRSQQSNQSRVISRAMAYMEQNPRCTVPALAEACGVSQATLYGDFQRVLKKTPNAVRQEVQCRMAIHLLHTTALSVEEVSRRAGFSSASYFRKILFAITGKTPKAVRQEAEVV